MITEDYVSFETAKLLKEKGFEGYSIINIYDEDAVNAYIKELKEKHLPYSSDDPKLKEFYYTIPTLQMAMKWLKEKHNIVVEPFIREDTKYVWYIHRIETRFNKKYLVFCWGSKNIKYESYEQACEAAIKYCLEKKLI